MNLQLHHVVTDITGVTGLAIIRAIVAGERDPTVLASHRDRRCHATVETVCQALVGNYREEHIFALTQALELYDVYQTKVVACDKQIEGILKRLRQTAAPPANKLLPARQRARQPNAPAFDARGALHAILGVDLTQIDGLGPSLALKLVGECGTSLAAWPTAKHFTSWLALAPHNKISGGRVLSSRTRRTSNRAASLLRLAAGTVGRTDTALGAFYRRLSARIGKAKAITATARKIAVLFYNTLRLGMAYADPGATYYEDRYRQRVLRNLQRRAKSLGFSLQPLEPDVIAQVGLGNFPARLAEVAASDAPGKPIEVWFQDEARIGQKNKITRRWAKRGSRPSAPSDQRTASTYIFGAICPERGVGAGLVLPWCNSTTMALHLTEISQAVAPGAHAVILLDQAGWHTSAKLKLPANISLLPLPPKSPELNPTENVWQYMRDNWLSNRVFESDRHIVYHCCDAWNKLVDQPWTIMSIGLRDWAYG